METYENEHRSIFPFSSLSLGIQMQEFPLRAVCSAEPFGSTSFACMHVVCVQTYMCLQVDVCVRVHLLEALVLHAGRAGSDTFSWRPPAPKELEQLLAIDGLQRYVVNKYKQKECKHIHV